MLREGAAKGASPEFAVRRRGIGLSRGWWKEGRNVIRRQRNGSFVRTGQSFFALFPLPLGRGPLIEDPVNVLLSDAANVATGERTPLADGSRPAFGGQHGRRSEDKMTARSGREGQEGSAILIGCCNRREQ